MTVNVFPLLVVEKRSSNRKYVNLGSIVRYSKWCYNSAVFDFSQEIRCGQLHGRPQQFGWGGICLLHVSTLC